MTEARQRRELSREECLRLLGEAQVGRVVCTYRALPAVRPVNHLVDGERIIIRAGLGSAISPGADHDAGTVVALRGRPDRRGRACRLERRGGRPGRARDRPGRARPVPPRAAALGRREADDIIAIRADVVTGFRLLPGAGSPAAPGAWQAVDRID